MKFYTSLATGALLALTLAGCVAADYTESESPKTLRVDKASARFDVRFAPGSSRLLDGDAARLRTLAAAGYMGPADRVTISASGPPALAAARFQAVAHELAAYSIVPADVPLAIVPRDRALIDTGRYLVTLPPCPNWGKPAAVQYSNTYPSNFGCADASNFGQMVWRPGDLVEGVPYGGHYNVNSTQQAPLAVFAAGGPTAAPALGTIYNATPGAMTNAINVLGCPNPLATGNVQATGAVTAGQQAQVSQVQQPCNLPPAPNPLQP